MTEPDQHSSPIKTPKQLIIVVALAFIVPIVIIGLLSQLLTSTPHDTSGDEQRVLERIKPVGSIVIADVSVPRGNLTGEQVYGQVCKTCHDAGLAGAPKSGDKGQWTARIAEGEKTLVQHAVAGFQGKAGVMPPKGGNTDLTDDEVHRAVVYLANQVGAGWKEPAPTAAAAAPAAKSPAAAVPAAVASTSTASPPSAAAAPAATPSASAAAAPVVGKTDGKATYDKTCAVCHATGLAGAPTLGDKAAWEPRWAKGLPALLKSTVGGLNGMPAGGQCFACTQADFEALIRFLAGHEA